MPPENSLENVKYSMMRNVMASATEDKLGGLSEKWQKIHTDYPRIDGPPTTTNDSANR